MRLTVPLAVHVVLALLALGVGLLWHLSYTQSVALMVLTPRGESYTVVGLYSAGGRLSLTVSRRTYDPQRYPWLAGVQRPPVPGMVKVQVAEPRHPGALPLLNGTLKHFAGFGLARDWDTAKTATASPSAYPLEYRYTAWWPHLLVIVLLAIAPLRRGWHYLSRVYRLHHGHCLACGYDRRATIPPHRCPECGGRLEVFA